MSNNNDYKQIIKQARQYLEYLNDIGVKDLPYEKARVKPVPAGSKQGGQGSSLPLQAVSRGGMSQESGVAAGFSLRNEVREHEPEYVRPTLESIRAELGDCKRCKLHKTRTNIVFGIGNPNAKLMFVGEGPGEDEDLQAEPFVGRAGQLLTKIIEAMGLKRSDVYIANVVKCRPPGNRNPEPDEISECRPFLEKQIDAIKPEIIVALGNHAVQTLLNTDKGITKIRGQFLYYKDNIRLMPTYHPSYLLRNESKKKDVWEDMQKVMAELGLKSSR